MIITIDGPTASGKSSVARLVAKQLGFCHFSTGLLYRAVAFLVSRGFENLQPQDLSDGLALVDFSFVARISAAVQGQATHIFFDNNDITHFLSDDALSQRASEVSAQAVVRQLLLDVQRDVGRRFDLVVDGRDCGTVVFPDAKFKFFLTASVQARAERMMNDPKRAGMYKNIEEACQEMIKRDERDQARALSPLVVPDNAFVIDNSALTLEQTAQKMIEKIEQGKGE